MKIQYLGTAAAEGTPAFWCSCDICEKARQAGGRNIRTRSQAVINDDLLIDFPADTYFHVLRDGLNLRKIHTLLITHGHDDHLYPYDLMYRSSPVYAVYPDDGEYKIPMDIFLSKKTKKRFCKFAKKEKLFKKDKKAVRINRAKEYSPFFTYGYIIHPMKANHAKYLDPLIYIIQKDGRTLLYAHDTGYFPKETWKYIKKNKIHFDFVSLDCTSTNREKVEGTHLNLTGCEMIRKAFLENGNADEKTIFCLNHFSHNGGYTYDELKPIAESKGFIVSYDGMTVEF